MFKQNFKTINISWDGDRRNETKRPAEDDDCHIFYHDSDESESEGLQLFGFCTPTIGFRGQIQTH